MKVICIDNKILDDPFVLTIGKEYEVLHKNPLIVYKKGWVNCNTKYEYCIMSDKGFEHYYPEELFITRKQNRNNKLEKLGI